MDDLDVLAARYVWKLRRDADKRASESDYQSTGATEAARQMYNLATDVENTLVDFISWVRKQQGAK